MIHYATLQIYDFFVINLFLDIKNCFFHNITLFVLTN